MPTLKCTKDFTMENGIAAFYAGEQYEYTITEFGTYRFNSEVANLHYIHSFTTLQYFEV